MAAATVEEVTAEVEAFVAERWSPDLTVREWWSRLAAARLSHPMLPGPWGRGYTRDLASAVSGTLGRNGAIGGPGGIGSSLTAPTLLAHASPELVDRLMPGIVTGADGWCQLFSEPGAGSDLAALQTKAERDGDEWVVSGQKVWTSTAQVADWGILIARTNPDVPKHKGITYFAFPMHQPGVDVRPLREMTGRAVFNEVFLDEARVPHANVIGDVDGGWKVANTTLMVERTGIGGGGGSFSAAAPGSVAGHLERRAGSFVGHRASLDVGSVGRGTFALLRQLAEERGATADPVVRQDLARLHTHLEIVRMTGLRAKGGGARTGGEGNLAKLRMTELVRQARHLAGELLGPGAALWGGDAPTRGLLQELIVFSPAPSIYGGTDEVQRNIIGERVLGLPKEPGNERDVPFRELLVGTQR